MAYRQYCLDFDVKEANEDLLKVTVSEGGVALDDFSLVALEDGAEPRAQVFFDLLPASYSRSRGFQACLANQLQWVNFSISGVNTRKFRNPTIAFYVPSNAEFQGINSDLLERMGAKRAGENLVEVTPFGAGGRRYTFPLPKLADDRAIDFGGVWVKIPSDTIANMRVEVEDDGEVLFAQDLVLFAIDEPEHYATPQKVLTVAYHVQSRKQSPLEREDALPRQFRMMGFNVWSDYGLSDSQAPVTEISENERVRIKAANDYGIRNFWPNFASFFQTEGGVHYKNLAHNLNEQDCFVVDPGGKVDRSQFNMRYVTSKGLSWQNSVMTAYKETLARPQKAGLPYRNTGFINDGLEVLVFSYDETTLRDFAKRAEIARDSFTKEDLQKRLNKEWTSYNLELYTECVKLWKNELNSVSPSAITVNTAGTFGPFRLEKHGINDRMRWGQEVTYQMPQWYGPFRYYGSHFSNELRSGLEKKVYGSHNGFADVIPLIQVSQGSNLDQPEAIRFKIFDFLSTSPIVKGIGFYIASHAFSDALTMVGISRATTLISEVEDYYIDGASRPELVKFISKGKPPLVDTLDKNGNAIRETASVESSVRLHTLSDRGRVALITVVSHCNSGRIGQEGMLRISPGLFEDYQNPESELVLLDHLNKKLIPFSTEIAIDTGKTGNMILLEIIERRSLDRERWRD